MRTNLYVFAWISDLGGADTRLKELLILLKNDFNITCIPNDTFRLKEKHNTDFLDHHGIKYCDQSELPKKLEGFAYANCNFRLFKEKERIQFINDCGLKFLWSNDMMWTTNEELEAIAKGQVACCLFTSSFHKNALWPKVYATNPNQKGAILDNYFDSSTWPYVSRPKRNMVCGKVSRDDHMKFSENFPIFYESAASEDSEFCVMGWSDSLVKKYSWFNFSNRWRFMKTNQVRTQDYFSSIDVFLYNCNHKFIENQSRAIIESQLTGCPIVAPNKWNFPNMIWNQRSGFLWNTLEECQEALRDLSNYEFRTKMGKLASECTKSVWCDSDSAKRKWNAVLNYVNGGNQ
jgi:glycosyltransferase involved in cell wall biosynthesis